VNKFLIELAVGSAIVLAAFATAWRLGWLKSLSTYVGETRDELRKCNWPSRQELWNSTVLVFVVLSILGLFTVASDFGILKFVRALL
jgi:preprotein translocase subunit SecE